MGQTISDLPLVEAPLRPSDLMEISRLVDGRYYSYKVPALAAYAGQATTSTFGVAELATNDETVEGADGERVVTPQGLEAMIRDVLQNRIVAGTGILLDYVDGVLTIAVDE